METCVTMSLERYKELESYEKAFQLLKMDTGKFIWGSALGNEYLVELSNEPNAQLVQQLKIAIELRDKIIEEVREYQEKTGKKIFKYG